MDNPINTESGWIEWKGGVQPVSNATKVKIQLRVDRDRETIDADPEDVGEAGQVDWSHAGFGERWEVVAYRIVGDAK